MGEANTKEGKCLCGQVTVKAAKVANAVGACHCGMCRRLGGGPFLAVDCGTEVELIGEDNIGVYSSSDWAERGFCKTCGTNLFYRLKQQRQYIVSAALFDGDFVFDRQIFIDDKPSYYEFANKTQNMTGAEVFAKYS